MFVLVVAVDPGWRARTFLRIYRLDTTIVVLKTSIGLNLCSTSANKHDSLWLCVSAGPACSSLKHKTSSGKLGHSSSASLIKCLSSLYMTVRSTCYDLMLKFPAQIRLKMRPSASSTISTLFCHIKCIRERVERERERERVQAGELPARILCCPVGPPKNKAWAFSQGW